MKKVKFYRYLKPNVYKSLDDVVWNAAVAGVVKAHKYSDKPTEESIAYYVRDYFWAYIAESFDMGVE